jgi:hypothetical protein
MKIKVLLILSLLSIWLLPLQLFALTPVDGNSIQLNNVILDYSGANASTWTNQKNQGFTFMTNGWGYLDIAGTGTLGNGLMPPGNYTFSSSNPRYSILQIGQIELNIYEYSYVIYFDKDFGQSGTITFEFTTLDPLYDDLIVVQYISFNQDYMYFRIYDNAYDEFNRTQVYNEGFSNGSLRSRNEFAIESDGQIYTASEWGVIQYNLGLAQGPQNTLAIRNMIPGILGITFAFFFQLASISFLGISALDLIGALITIATSIFIIRIFLNR